ncbi:MAG: ABC transporter ATP-binding protein [Telmatospirillum sp.]|nr:ABC transporter ATP-binding protein [Telmatospirillum sp.]
MLLDVRDLDFGHGKRAVGRALSLSVDAGQVLCLLGPNGSGKTTLFRTILGLLPALAGDILIDGDIAQGWSRRRFARTVAFVPQSHGSFFAFAVEDVVLMGRTSRFGTFASPSARDRDLARHCLDLVGYAHLAERAFPELSGGEQQMVLIARALAQEPRLLIMDEPTANLDFGNRVRLLGEIRRLADRGLGVVLSTHDPDHALQIADQVVLLHRGQAIVAGSPGAVVTAASLRRGYGVEVAILDAGEGRRVCVSTIRPGDRDGAA